MAMLWLKGREKRQRARKKKEEGRMISIVLPEGMIL